MDPLRSGTHLPVLDGIRGMAIALIVIYHAVLSVRFKPTVILDRVVLRVVEFGWTGVDLFFVLSGFLITGILYEAKNKQGYFRNFYARRILRIFPIYYGFLCFLFIILPRLASPSEQLSALLGDHVWYSTYLVNVWVALNDWHPFPLVSHLWSLAVEEQFYLVWPWIVFLLSRRALMSVCLGLVASSLVVRVASHATGFPLAAFVLTPARMDALALGGLVALVAREPGGFLRLKRWAPLTALASAACLATIFLWRQGFKNTDPLVTTVGLTFLATLFASVLAIAVASPPQAAVAQVFSLRFLRSLGRYSYAMYIFHVPIIVWLYPLVSVISVPTLAGSHLPRQLVFLAVTGSVSLLAAMVSWYLYESHFLKLKTLFSYQGDARVRNDASDEARVARLSSR